MKKGYFFHFSLLTYLMTFGLMVSGHAITVLGVTHACTAWLLCKGAFPPTNLGEWVHMVHRGITLLSGVFLLALFLQTWRFKRHYTGIMVATTVATVLFLAQVLMGIHEVEQDYPTYLRVVHWLTAMGMWTALGVATVLAWRFTEERSVIRVGEAENERQHLGQRLKDYLMLTKPIVVALLLLTTLAGMVVGRGGFPDWSTIFWTLLGGAMAAGGSSAINQYIDRYDDEKMQRTYRRPIPSRRVTPAEGLAFGSALALSSIYIMVVFVNILAALLTLLGIVYYILLYSLWLKKTTVQNIVIGGGAGAIPPLVGWASATGHLNISALFLFAVVFLWTPPHFWALALVRRKDYARAGVPMLPVVRGEHETRWYILLYTIELFILTLILPLFGLGGVVYWIAAIVLGGFLLSSAWRLWRQGGNKVAWKMYRHSSMYLALLFLALMVDVMV